VPTIATFYGIVIRMYFAPGEHGPAHFHAYYNEFKATVDIHSCEIAAGHLPAKQRKLALAWAELHREDLLVNWSLVMSGRHPVALPPLR